ncbi:MAG: hypothetical protein JXA67_14900 [Micromonosporaceae bacterium]|nr:hypothetical protein [Micromonosporaceae bacterium]
MRRMLWLGVGLAVGAIVVRAVTKRAQAWTPSGAAASARIGAAGMIDSARALVDDIREGMAEREAEIQAAFVDGVTVEADWAGGDSGDFTTEEGMRYR